MSIIGPRPALWNQYDLLEERDKYGANDVKPGLSGWAQICGRDELEIEESTADQVKKLTAKREECAKKIDARTMSAYERIRASVHNHLAVVTVYNGDSCGGCFSTITPQRLIDIASNTKLVICEHCGRIIVNPDFA